MIHFSDSVKVINGIFFVSKKRAPGKPRRLRMILDCRNTNLFFRVPPVTVLGSVESLSKVRIPGKGVEGRSRSEGGSESNEDQRALEEKYVDVDEVFNCLFMSQEDVQDFFYRISTLCIPGLDEYFGLPEVDLHILARLYQRQGRKVPEEIQNLSREKKFANPAMSVLSMGWAWAFFLAQRVHETACSEALPEADLLVDRRPAPKLSPFRSCVMLYADNANHLSLSKHTSDRSRLRLKEVLES